MKKIDSFPGKTLGLLADLHLKLQHGGRTPEELERFLKGEPLFHQFLTIPVDRTKSAMMPKTRGTDPDQPKPFFPKLHSTGPRTLEFARLELHYHPDGQRPPAYVHSDKIREYLVETGKIEQCLGLRDGEELKKHLKCFPAHWKGKRLLLWRSLCLSSRDQLYVPSLYETDNGVELGWEYMAFYPDYLPTLLYV